jgi:hypothetical protein
MTQTEALKLALEALKTEQDIYREHDEDGAPEYILDAIAAIKEALMSLQDGAQSAVAEQHKQRSVSEHLEPVAWGFQNSAITGSNRWMMLREEIPANDQYGGALWTPLYTTPPPVAEPHKRKPLTDEQISLIAHNIDSGDWNDLNFKECWHEGFKAGFREAEIEHNIKGTT